MAAIETVRCAWSPGGAGRVRPERHGARVGGPPAPRRRRRHVPERGACRASTRSCPTSQYLAERRGQRARHRPHARPRGPHRRAGVRAAGGAGARLRQPPDAGLRARRLRERGVEADLRLLTPGQPVELGPFRVHPIRVAHSVLDSLALAIETPAGVVLASGDFKIDRDAPPEERTDLEALSAWGDRGVLALLSDSTNVEQRGRTGGEDDVRPAFEEILARTPGASLVSCFATSIPRIQRVADARARPGRPIALPRPPHGGQRRGGARPRPAAHPRRVVLHRGPARRSTPAARLALFVSGSQGEPFSALSLVSLDEHRGLAVGPGRHGRALRAADPRQRARGLARDRQPVPPRLRRGAPRHRAASTSPATARRTTWSSCCTRVRPRYLVPVHGEYRMLAQHARLAAQAGLPADRVLVAEDGDVLALARRARARRSASRPAASCSTAPAPRSSRTWWCATAATSPPRASWCRWWCSTSRRASSSRRRRS